MVVIVGHTRLEAAKALGLKTVPVHVVEGLTPAQARAYRLMDNRSHENAEWDDELLKLEFGDLKLDGFDLDLTGFDTDQLSELLAGESVEASPTPTRHRPFPNKVALGSETYGCWATIASCAVMPTPGRCRVPDGWPARRHGVHRSAL